jgi:hypothetical protein
MGAKLASLSGVLGATQDRGLTFITSSTFSAASSVSVDGCFTAAYDNYRVMIRTTGGGTGTVQTYLRLRVAGVDSSAASYNAVNVYGYPNTAGAEGFNAATEIDLGTNDLSNASVRSLDFHSPALAAKTLITGTAAMYHGSVTWVSRAVAGGHSASTAYDGFTIYPLSSTLTGALFIYGYRTS